MATKRAITPRPAALVRLAGALAPAAAVEAVLDGRPDDAEPDDAEPDDGDNGAARRRDAVVAEAVAEIQRAALAAIRAGDVRGAVRTLAHHLPPRELAPLAERLRRVGRRRRSST